MAVKRNTYNRREVSSRTRVDALWQSSAIVVQAYDPIAMEKVELIYGKHAGLTPSGDKYAALQHVDALVICTEWQQFRVPDMATSMRTKVIIDERNLYEPQKLQMEGWHFLAVARAALSTTAVVDLVTLGKRDCPPSFAQSQVNS